MIPGALVSVEVTAETIARGDRLTIGGQDFTVRDLTTMQRGAKRLEFDSGETFTMTASTVLWAARRYPRRSPVRRRRPPAGA